MPGIDGFEVLQNIRENKNTSITPVLILTSKHVSKEELKILKGNNIFQLIQKGDVNLDELLSTIAIMVNPKPEKVKKSESPKTKIAGIPTILIVEDNPDNMLTLKALLADDYIVLEATHGKQAVEISRQHLPNLILMDIALPDMDGFEVLELLRREDKIKSIPVVALTASAMIYDKDAIIASGFDEYLTKPIDENVFFKIINEFLNG